MGGKGGTGTSAPAAPKGSNERLKTHLNAEGVLSDEVVTLVSWRTVDAPLSWSGPTGSRPAA